MPRRTARVSSQRFAAGEANDLIMKLQELLPDSISGGFQKASSPGKAKILKEACNYIKKLHKEVDDLSENIAQLPHLLLPGGGGVDSTGHAGIIVERIQQ